MGGCEMRLSTLGHTCECAGCLQGCRYVQEAFADEEVSDLMTMYKEPDRSLSVMEFLQQVCVHVSRFDRFPIRTAAFGASMRCRAENIKPPSRYCDL